MSRYWCSFYFIGAHGADSDYRPINFPPHEAILGYWNSGYRLYDEAITLCLLVQAETEDEAKNIIKIEWPESVSACWRFFNEHDNLWLPGDRFPISDWAEERIAKGGSICGTM